MAMGPGCAPNSLFIKNKTGFLVSIARCMICPTHEDIQYVILLETENGSATFFRTSQFTLLPSTFREQPCHNTDIKCQKFSGNVCFLTKVLFPVLAAVFKNQKIRIELYFAHDFIEMSGHYCLLKSISCSPVEICRRFGHTYCLHL
jgi:hypothetical protein